MNRMINDVTGYILDINELGEISQEGNVKRLALTHLSPPPEGNLQMNKNFIKPLKAKYDGKIISGDDGTVITIPLD